MNEQLSVVGIKMEIDAGMPSNNLTPRIGVQREEQRVRTEPCGTPNSSSYNSARVDMINFEDAKKQLKQFLLCTNFMRSLKRCIDCL